jgi:glycosyltransferase involved in cell wall biosynthesis
MIKVFHIITHFDLGGAERVAINICKSKNKNFEYHLFEVVRGHSDFSEQIINELKHNNIFYHQSLIKNKKIALLLFPFFFLLKTLKYKPEIIHTHTEIPDLSIIIYEKLAKIFAIKNKYVRTIHNTQLWNEWKKIGRKVEPFFQKQEANVAISESVKHNYELEYQHKVDYFVYNGVEKSVEEKFYNIIPNKINVLFAGRLEHQKGIIELISTLKKLSNDQRFHFHISAFIDNYKIVMPCFL